MQNSLLLYHNIVSNFYATLQCKHGSTVLALLQVQLQPVQAYTWMITDHKLMPRYSVKISDAIDIYQINIRLTI